MLRSSVRSRAIILAASMLAIPTIASAVEVNFNSASGDFNAPANWNGGVFPTTADAASINNGGTATISATPANGVFELWVGSNTINPATTAPGLSSNLVQTGGTLDVAAWTVIGRAVDAAGGHLAGTSTYTITGGVLNTDQIEIGQSFGAGVTSSVGILDIGGTAVVNARNYLRVGHGDFGSYAGTGSVIVKGNAQLNVGGGAAPDFVAFGFNGFNKGNVGTFTIQDNAQVNLKMPLRIGWVEEGHGTASVSGNSRLIIDSGELSAAAFMLGDYNNGANTSPDNRPIGEFSQSGGFVRIGDFDRRPIWSAIGGSGKGTYNLSGGKLESYVRDALTVADTDQNGNAGEGHFNITGGTANLNELWAGKIGRAAGTVTQSAGTVNVGIDLGADGDFRDRAGGDRGNVMVWNGAINLGGFEGHELDDATGGDVPTNWPVAAATGLYNLSGGSVHAKTLVIGHRSTGVFNQTGGTSTFDTGILIARTVNQSGTQSTGTLNVAGGTLTTLDIRGGTGVSTVNLNGGVLKGLANSNAFITGVTAVVAGASGAKIDSGGFSIATSQQITGTGSLTKLGAGTLSLSAAIAYAGGTNIEGGTLKLSGLAQTSILAAAGSVDIKNGKLALDYTGSTSPQAVIVPLLAAGYAQNPQFSSGKIKSSTATSARGLGWINDTATSTFTVAAALYGDTDLNGTVNFDDLLKVAQFYDVVAGGKSWAQGDSTYDGIVNFDDLLKVAQNYGGSIALDGTAIIESGLTNESFNSDFALALTLVPEPTSIAGLALLAGVARRRRA